MNKKQELEKAVCDRFVNGENILPPHKHTYTIKEYRDAPDCVLVDGKENEIGLEITTAYYDHDRARGTWTTIKSKKGIYSSKGNYLGYWNPTTACFEDEHGNRVKLPTGDVIVEPDKCLASFVQNQINEKCQKDYGYQCILIIYLHAPLWDDETLKTIRKTIQIPERNPFFEIYIHVHVPSSGKFVFYKI